MQLAYTRNVFIIMKHSIRELCVIHPGVEGERCTYTKTVLVTTCDILRLSQRQTNFTDIAFKNFFRSDSQLYFV